MIDVVVRRIANLANNTDPSNNLLIFSDPRGGSTWITETLHELIGAPVLWEPLHLRQAPQFRDLNFGWRQVIPEQAEWHDAEAAFDRLLRGRSLTSWNTQFSSATSLLRADRMIVKFCRANGMLPWLVRKFAPRRLPILLVRHPFAVAASQIKFGSWDHISERFQIPQVPYNECYLEHRDFLSSIETKAERQVAIWCIANAPLLNPPTGERKWITVFYENLLQHPEDEIARIFELWGFHRPKDIELIARKQSRTTKASDLLGDVEQQLGKWVAHFDGLTVDRLMRVLSYFKITAYGRDVRPQTK